MPNWGMRVPELDGLRGIAILLVLLRHSIFGLETSSRLGSVLVAAGQLTWSGVDLFFVLSGFLIGGILLDARNSPRYFQTFYIRRFFRIFPLYFVVTGLFLFRHLPFRIQSGALGDVSALTIPWWSYATLTQNFWMVRLGWYGPLFMSVTWSLAVEEQFYLTVPWLIRKVSIRCLPVILGGIVAGAPLLRTWLFYRYPHGDFACYVLMPCRADALCLGVLLALLVRKPTFWQRVQEKRPILIAVTAALFAGVAFMTYKQYGQFSAVMVTAGYSWLGLFYAACLLLAVAGHGETKGQWLRYPPLMGLGTLAYCSYLIHRPVIEALRRIASLWFSFSPKGAFLLGSSLGVAVTLLVAAGSWKFFEKSLLLRGHRYKY